MFTVDSEFLMSKVFLAWGCVLLLIILFECSAGCVMNNIAVLVKDLGLNYFILGYMSWKYGRMMLMFMWR